MLVIQTLAKSVKAADPALIKLFHETDVYSPGNSPCEKLFQMCFLLEVLASSLVSAHFKTQVYEHYGAMNQRSGKRMSTVLREGGLPPKVVKQNAPKGSSKQWARVVWPAPCHIGFSFRTSSRRSVGNPQHARTCG